MFRRKMDSSKKGGKNTKHIAISLDGRKNICPVFFHLKDNVED